MKHIALYLLLMACALSASELPILPLPRNYIVYQRGAPSETRLTSSHVIVSGDYIKIVSKDYPELSGELQVNKTGIIKIPTIGALIISGLKISQTHEYIVTIISADHQHIEFEMIFEEDRASKEDPPLPGKTPIRNKAEQGGGDNAPSHE